MINFNRYAALEWVSRGFLFGLGLVMALLVAELIVRMVSS